jgi:hypothetical protein
MKDANTVVGALRTLVDKGEMTKEEYNIAAYGAGKLFSQQPISQHSTINMKSKT